MKNLKKKNMILKFMVLSIISSAFILSGFKAYKPVKIYANDELIKSDQEPFILDSRVFLPLRAVAENLGAKVTYKKENKSINIEREDSNIYLAIGDDMAWISNKKMAGPALLDCPPIIKNNRTFLPLRSVAELLGMVVEWDGNIRAVYINEKSNLPKYINENNAASEVLLRLKELQIIDDKAYVTDVKKYSVKFLDESDQGYFVSVRKDNPIDKDLSELVGQYFINDVGTLLLEYDPLKDDFKLLIGVN